MPIPFVAQPVISRCNAQVRRINRAGKCLGSTELEQLQRFCRPNPDSKPNFPYGEGVHGTICWTPNIERNVLETPNTTTRFWGPYAEPHFMIWHIFLGPQY